MQMNEPKLRFKADDGSEFPDWEEKKLGDITKKISRKDENSNADVRMISQGNGFILQATKYSRENAGQSLKKYTLLKRNEFAYNHGASKAKPYGVCYRLSESDEARVPYVYHTFKLTKGNVDYWNYALNTSYMDRQLKKLVSSGVRMDGLLNINYDSYMSVKIRVASLPEQQKIADFLSTIDTVIEKQKATVEAWEERKKGVMQKLFSQEVRFKADDGSEFPDWEEKKVNQIGKVVTGNTPSTKEADNYGGDFLWVTPTDIESKAYIKKTGRLLTQKGKSKARILPAGTVLVTCIASIGKNCILDSEGSCNQQINAVVPNGMMFSYFIYVAFEQRVHELEVLGGNGGMKIVNKSLFENFRLPYPCLAEQQKIADCLSSLDDVIEKQKATLAAWEEMKKGLLQQMFV